ncbi:MAG: ligD [Gemmatimonadetes bacterium]|nr:ligD [Gemmatimonadota bacterium]
MAPRTRTALPSPARRAAPARRTTATVPEMVLPELATLVDHAPLGAGWLHEVKLDGYRLVCIVAGGAARLLTRRGNDWTPRFPRLAAALSALPDGTVVDGELVVVTADGTTSFQALQAELGAGRESRLVYYAFDLMFDAGQDLREQPLVDRKARLQGRIDTLPKPAKGDPTVRYSDHVLGSGEAFHTQACRWALEGIVSKRADSPYRSRRTRDWVKVKCARRQEFVVGGFTAPRGTRVGLGALLLGYYGADGRLLYAGKVGTGFDDALLRSLQARLSKDVTPDTPFADLRRMSGVRWVKPRVVAEVAFAEWTEDGHLRHPTFQGIREDKAPGDVRREMPVPAPASASSSAEGTAPGDAAAPIETPAKKAPRKSPATMPIPLPRSTARHSRPTRGRAGAAVEVAGVRLTNPERVLWPDAGLTKLDLARYYAAVGRWILPHVADRPLSLVRCPEGIESQCFYQKHADERFPAAIGRVVVEQDDPRPYTYVDGVPGLVAFAQAGVVELHVWGARRDRIERPDRIVVDLDPAPDVPWARVVHAAFEVRGRLQDLGLESWVKTTGGKGLHVVVPIARRAGWDEVKGFSRALVEDVAAGHPGWYLTTATLSKRAGRIFLDYLRNGRGATAICAYGVRARPGATVSVPLRWSELTPRLDPAAFTLRTVPRRLASLRADPWEGFAEARQSITRPMLHTLGAA